MMRRMLRTGTSALLLTVFALLACSAARFAHADEGDPPQRVARLSDAEGWVSLQPAGVEQWTAATVNRPLTAGDRLWSDQNSRAELDIGEAVIRLGSNTGFAFLDLDDRSAQMQLSTGTLIVRVREMQAGQTYEIDAPNVAISLQQPGEYRADINERGDLTVVRVSQGAALAAGADGQQVALGAQEQLTVSGTNPVAYDSTGLGAPDELDNWSAARERQFEDAASQEYVASDVPGMQDLDDSGQWQEAPEYGYVWIPTAVSAGWVPYRYGHWVWIAPWGWTWVDDARWGFAPFHYGRWTQCGGRWCWVPGPRQARPVYAPALVAWVGGASLGTSAYGRNVGWFPLAPHEVYIPAYRVSGNYLRTINTANTGRLNNTYITAVYENRITPAHYANNRAASVTAVPQSILTSGQSVGTHAAALSTALLSEAVVTAAAPAIAPIHQSVLGAAEGHGVVKPLAARANRPVVARTTPPPAPANFDTQLAAIQANGGHPVSRNEIESLQPATSAVRVAVVAGGSIIAASALPHRVGATQPAGTIPRPAQASGTTVPSLADRERLLQNSRLPPASRLNPSGAPTAAHAGGTSSGQAWSSDRSSAQPYAPHPPPHPGLVTDDSTRASASPRSVPVYHPPPRDASITEAESLRAEEVRSASPRIAPAFSASPVPRALPPPRPPPSSAQSRSHTSSQPRDSASHGDREPPQPMRR